MQPGCGAWAAPEPEPLAGAVLRLLRAPRPELRAAARRRAEQFGWDRTVAAMIGIHAEVIEAGTGRGAASSA